MPVSTVDAPTAQLTNQDRCDRCGAQAYVRATIAGSDLLFCGHHFRAHEAGLTAAGAAIVDERHRIGE